MDIKPSITSYDNIFEFENQNLLTLIQPILVYTCVLKPLRFDLH